MIFQIQQNTENTINNICRLFDFFLYLCLLIANINPYIYIYYRFIVRFPIGLDFLFITFTFLLHLLLSWTSSSTIPIKSVSHITKALYTFIFGIIIIAWLSLYYSYLVYQKLQIKCKSNLCVNFLKIYVIKYKSKPFILMNNKNVIF